MALYAEKVAKATNSMTGEKFSGVARWIAPADLMGNEIDNSGFDFSLISHKDVRFGQTRTISAYWALGAYPEGLLNINKADADQLGVKDGDKVEVTSRTTTGEIDLGNGETFKMVAKVKAVQGLRPGVVAM